MTPDRLLSITEVAAQLRYDPRTIRRYIKAGKLPVIRLTTGTIRIRQSAVHRLISSEPWTPLGESDHGR